MTDIMKKMLNIDRRVIWVICVALTVWPLISPIGLPIKVDELTIMYHDALEELPPGSIVLASIDIEAGLVGENGAQCIDTLRHLFEKDIKFIQICFYRPDGAVLFETMWLPQVDQHDKVYGVDWVNMGYVEGHETAMSAFAHDFLYPVKDYYGNMLEDLPLMNEVKSMDDVDLYIDIAAGDWDQAIRQFATPYNLPAITGCQSLGIPDAMPYIEAGIIIGALSGLPGSAQYELLRQKPGLAIRGMDAASAVHIFLLCLTVVTNIAYISVRSKGEKV